MNERPGYSADLPYPPSIARLLHDAGYRGHFHVERRDARPITSNDEAHLAGMLRAIETDLEDAKARDA